MARPVAVVSGGSSGIGLEVARLLRQRGYDLHLIARDAARLVRAGADLNSAPLAGHGGAVQLHALDVCDAGACSHLIGEILALGRIDWLVTSAGMAEPGMFLDQPAEAFRRHMETNYFGTLNLVIPAARAMAEAGRGRIVMVASAAAFTGIVGYAGYCPSKAAVKALGEALYAELAVKGVFVSVAFPPDTDTPQLAAEAEKKPQSTKEITAGGGILSPQDVARNIVDNAEAGAFSLVPEPLMKLFSWFHSLYAPFFLRRQKKVLEKTKG